MDKNQIRETVARRAARELKDGYIVNLGIGLPTQVVQYLPDHVKVTIHSENGILGMGPKAAEGAEDPALTDAGGTPVTLQPGASICDTATSFGYIRGRHVDVTILGTFQVDEKGDMANWTVPGKKTTGMGGAMDLLAGAKRVIIAMEHTQKGKHKILKECTLPLTAPGVVDRIITEMGVLDVTPEGLVLVEYNQEFTIDQIKEATGCPIIISPQLKSML